MTDFNSSGQFAGLPGQRLRVLCLYQTDDFILYIEKQFQCLFPIWPPLPINCVLNKMIIWTLLVQDGFHLDAYVNKVVYTSISVSLSFPRSGCCGSSTIYHILMGILLLNGKNNLRSDKWGVMECESSRHHLPKMNVRKYLPWMVCICLPMAR